jgi:hypothetical protein
MSIKHSIFGKGHIIGLYIRCEALKLLEKVGKYEDLVIVEEWIPRFGGNPVSIYSAYEDSHLVVNFDELKPVIKGVDVFWAYSSSFVEDALKVFDIFDKPCEIKALPKPAPLWLEEEKDEELKSELDGIVLVAPRVYE